MTDRLNKIFAVLPDCNRFADIGCDHGYIAYAMLKNGKCKFVTVSDISAKCLEKAKELLSRFIADGRAEAVVSDGFDKVQGADLALIAGMGGEEICSIIEKASALPENLVLQPMKNCDKVRRTAVNLGYKIEKDFVFFSGGKFYDLISLVKGQDFLTEEEEQFGRDNVKGNNPDFKKSIKIRIQKLSELLSRENLSKQTAKDFEEEMEKLSKYV